MSRLLLCASLLLCGCDAVGELLPQTEVQAAPTSQVSLALRVVGETPDTLSAIQAYELDVVDVLLHRVEDDRWLFVNDATFTITRAHQLPTVMSTPIPVAHGVYDVARIEIGEARVASDGYWRDVELENPTIDLGLFMEHESAIILGLTLDAGASLTKIGGGWQVDPAFAVSVTPVDDPRE